MLNYIDGKIGIKRRHRLTLLLMALPFVIFVFIFFYVPLFGWVYAFYNFMPGRPFSQLEFTGFRWFTLAFTGTSPVLNVLRNTLVLSGLRLFVSVLPMFFAIFISEVRFKRVSRFTQTISTLPNFLSWVTIYAVFFAIFAPGDGLLNLALNALGHRGMPANILIDADRAWFFQTSATVYKEIGFSAIIYLAAINGIDPEQYDAASVDGANRIQRIWFITIPNLMQTFFVLLILGIGNMLNTGFDQYFVFANSFTLPRLDVLDTYIYRIGILQNNYSLGTAIGIMKSLVSITLLFSANRLSKWIRGNPIF